jgi:rubredoxin
MKYLVHLAICEQTHGSADPGGEWHTVPIVTKLDGDDHLWHDLLGAAESQFLDNSPGAAKVAVTGLHGWQKITADIFCPKCGCADINVIEITSCEDGDIHGGRWPLLADGFVWDEDGCYQDSSTMDETAECENCSHQGPLSDFNFGNYEDELNADGESEDNPDNGQCPQCGGFVFDGKCEDCGLVMEDEEKEYRVFCSWTVCGQMVVRAKSPEDAQKKAEGPDAGLPDGDYLDDSFQVDRVELEKE